MKVNPHLETQAAAARRQDGLENPQNTAEGPASFDEFREAVAFDLREAATFRSMATMAGFIALGAVGGLLGGAFGRRYFTSPDLAAGFFRYLYVMLGDEAASSLLSSKLRSDQTGEGFWEAYRNDFSKGFSNRFFLSGVLAVIGGGRRRSLIGGTIMMPFVMAATSWTAEMIYDRRNDLGGGVEASLWTFLYRSANSAISIAQSQVLRAPRLIAGNLSLHVDDWQAVRRQRAIALGGRSRAEAEADFLVAEAEQLQQQYRQLHSRVERLERGDPRLANLARRMSLLRQGADNLHYEAGWLLRETNRPELVERASGYFRRVTEGRPTRATRVTPPADRSQIRIACVFTGQMWYGAQHTLVARALDRILQARGYPRIEFSLSTSAGVLAGHSAAVRPEHLDDGTIRRLWHLWRKRTRPAAVVWSYLTRGMAPHSAALDQVLDRIPIRTIPGGPTKEVMVATAINPAQRREAVSGLGSLFRLGMQYFLTAKPAPLEQVISEKAAHLAQSAEAMFEPRYCHSHPWDPAHGEPHPQMRVADSVADLRLGTQASTWIPFVFGIGFKGVKTGGERQFDGVWSVGAPIETALRMGATHVLVFNDSPKPVPEVRQREVQYNIFHAVQKGAAAGERVTRWMNGIPWARRIPRAFRATNHFLREQTGPLDLANLRRNYPDRVIEVIGRDPQFPGDVSRFFERRPWMVDRILDLAEPMAKDIADRYFPPLNSSI